MDIVFRKIRGCAVTPGAGEVILLPSAAERRDYAHLALTSGGAAFRVGPETTRRIVVDADPTLDDMLAATMIAQLLNAETLSAGLQPFARYAALVREGLKPTEIPLEVSLEGIFLALRSTTNGSLEDPAVGARFLTEWQRMAERILKAASTGVNPFTTPLFESEPEFARERAFLRQDHEVFHQDVRRGEHWQIAIPGGPPQGSALLLRQPKSLLFKYWSRRGDDANLLLCVTASAGQWVFSTDPIQRLSLKPLAELLQSAEAAQDGKRASADPWFDGQPFAHTLVAAPRGGTVLADPKVIAIVKSWCRARSAHQPNKLLRRAGVLATAAVLLIAVGLAWHFRPRAETPTPPDRPIQRGLSVDNPSPSVKGNLHVLTVGVSQYKDAKYNLKLARGDADKLAEVIQKHSVGLFEKFDVTVLTDEQATRQQIIKKLAHLKRTANNQHDFVIVTLAGHGAHLDENKDFYFLPHDYDDVNKDSSGVFWDDLKRSLGHLPCKVLLVLDTCHSGTVTRQLRGEHKTALESGVYQMQKSGSGMVVMAACLGSGTAQEKNEWGHGALTLALLEGLSGTYYFRGKTQTELPKGKGDTRVITLHDLNVYVTNRVQELAGDHQAVVTNQTGDIALTNIPIASARGPK